jgi:signal transduction histidine kinase
VRRRLVLAIAGVATLAVTLFAVPLALVLQRTYRDEALLRLQRDTVAATRGIDIDANRRDPIELPDHGELAVYDTGGRRIAGRGGPPTGDDIVREVLREQAPAAHAEGGRLVVAVPLVVSEQVTGIVRAERDDAEATSLARGQWWLLIAIAVGVIVAAILAALALGRRLSRPLERLADAARDLGEGNFAARAPRTGVREVDEVGNALDATAARLDALVMRERAFSADASHQLRTPLAALRIELEALELHEPDSIELRNALTQVDRLQRTIDTMLAVARDAPRPATATPIGALCDDAASRWGARLAAGGRSLRLEIDDGGASARAPASVLREILDVLLDNAERHGSGTVTLRARRSDGSMALDVADEGRGIDSDREAIFARRSGQDGGHGIGLALARSLAHAEGGQLTVTSASPPVFTLLVPRAG